MALHLKKEIKNLSARSFFCTWLNKSKDYMRGYPKMITCKNAVLWEKFSSQRKRKYSKWKREAKPKTIRYV